MKKVFHFDSPTEVYRADACVISCFDVRFDLAVRKFLKRRGIAVYDHVKIPGAAKPLASPKTEAEREFVLDMVRTSVRLHQDRRVLLIGHNECGAYAGAGTGEIVADLNRAAGVLLAREPSLAVECYFADFDGLYAVGKTAAGRADDVASAAPGSPI